MAPEVYQNGWWWIGGKYPKCPRIYLPKLSAQAQNFSEWWIKASLGVRSPCFKTMQSRHSQLVTMSTSLRSKSFGFLENEVHKVHIFWEGHKILRNLHPRFVLCSASQIYSGDFVKFCGRLRIHELYLHSTHHLLLFYVGICTKGVFEWWKSSYWIK